MAIETVDSFRSNTQHRRVLSAPKKVKRVAPKSLSKAKRTRPLRGRADINSNLGCGNCK